MSGSWQSALCRAECCGASASTRDATFHTLVGASYSQRFQDVRGGPDLLTTCAASRFLCNLAAVAFVLRSKESAFLCLLLVLLISISLSVPCRWSAGVSPTSHDLSTTREVSLSTCPCGALP